MTLHDQELAEIIKNREAVEIQGKQFYIEPNNRRGCENCYFDGKPKCPPRAVTYCTSNGGNILVEVEPNKE